MVAFARRAFALAIVLVIFCATIVYAQENPARVRPALTNQLWLPHLPGPAAVQVNAQASQASEYEVWLTDQNNTAGFVIETAPRGTYGGRLLIYDSADLDDPNGPINLPEVINLAEFYALDNPNNSTGANVVRPHMAIPSPDHRYVAIAFVASGHVAIIDGDTRTSKALFRMTPGAAGAIQAHAAFWTADMDLIVANQNGKLLERINYDPALDTFTHDTAATLNLATCVTPSNNPCQSTTPLSDTDPNYWGPNNRPDNAPICPIISERGLAFVTLRGGGLFVVDVAATPMHLVAAYGNLHVGRDGCGGAQDKKNIYLNGGAGTLATNPAEFNLYHLRDQFPNAPATVPDNYADLMPHRFFHDPAPHRDAHGIVLTLGKPRYLWQLDRLANVAEVFRLPSKQHVASVPLSGTVSSDPTPDLGSLSPNGDRIYIALRGPQPQTGAHASIGNSPGLGIITLSDNGANGSLTHVLATSFLNPVNGSEESDPHAALVRLK